mmetsp:Transcript_8106/g.16501  ORF Transcript_8106/g.16501 Transcript_8106/m.16501 type:complete len:333 (+) Transcript_8106:273-1271(+)
MPPNNVELKIVPFTTGRSKASASAARRTASARAESLNKAMARRRRCASAPGGPWRAAQIWKASQTCACKHSDASSISQAAAKARSKRPAGGSSAANLAEAWNTATPASRWARLTHMPSHTRLNSSRLLWALESSSDAQIAMAIKPPNSSVSSRTAANSAARARKASTSKLITFAMIFGLLLSSLPPKRAEASRNSPFAPKVKPNATSKNALIDLNPYPAIFRYSVFFRLPAALTCKASNAKGTAPQKVSCNSNRSFAAKRRARQMRTGSSMRIFAHQSVCKARSCGQPSTPSCAAMASSAWVRSTMKRTSSNVLFFGHGDRSTPRLMSSTPL